MSSALVSHCLADLAFPDIQEYLRRDDLVLIPLGSCEQHGAHLPIDVVITATVTRIEVGEWLAVTQRFNPAAFGCDVGRNPSWATSAWHRTAVAKDAERAQFVESVVAWGKLVQAKVDDEIRKRGTGTASIDRSRAQIYRCRPKPG